MADLISKPGVKTYWGLRNNGEIFHYGICDENQVLSSKLTDILTYTEFETWRDYLSQNGIELEEEDDNYPE